MGGHCDKQHFHLRYIVILKAFTSIIRYVKHIDSSVYPDLNEGVDDISENVGVGRHPSSVPCDVLQYRCYQGLMYLLYHLVSPDVHR